MTRRPMCFVCLLLMAAMCAADWLGIPLIRGNPLPESLTAWVKEHPQATICGEVVRCTDTQFSQSIYLKNTYLIFQSEKFSIKNVRVYLKKKKEIQAGTLLLVKGKLQQPDKPRNPGEFDSRQYYACEHIYYLLKNGEILKKSQDYSAYGQFLLDVQKKLARVLDRTAGEAAPVLRAIVLGDKSALEPETKMRYQMAGIVHILAISGLHISLLGAGLYKLLVFTGIGIWPSGMLALTVMLQYGLMTGGSVSTMRAVCMFLIMVGAKIAGRIYDMLTALAVTAILILVDTPAYLYQSGFLMSFGAVLGIGVVFPALQEILGKENRFIKSLLSSFGVMLTTLPVMMWAYGEISIAGIFLNLVVLPSAGVVLGSGVGAALLGCVHLRLGWLAAWPGRLLLFFYEKLTILAGRFPWCTWISGQPRLWQIFVYYGVLMAVLAGGVFLKKKGKKVLPWVLSSAVLLGNVFCLGYHPLKYVTITCLDVGQGDGIVVETPENFCFLIDGGSTNKSAVGQYQLIPYLKNRGISYLDGIFISHTDEDHISGTRELLDFMAKGLTGIRAGTLYLPDLEQTPQAWKELADLARQAGVRVQRIEEGDRIQAGDTRINVLAPDLDAAGDDVNEDAAVLEIEYGDFQALFTGDIGEETEKELLKKGLLEDVDFLKVGHHGSRYSSCTAFLEKIKPEVGVISCSDSNTYGHPSAETIQRLEDAGCRVEYTMKHGAITVISDGKMMGVLQNAAPLSL